MFMCVGEKIQRPAALVAILANRESNPIFNWSSFMAASEGMTLT